MEQRLREYQQKENSSQLSKKGAKGPKSEEESRLGSKLSEVTDEKNQLQKKLKTEKLANQQLQKRI